MENWLRDVVRHKFTPSEFGRALAQAISILYIKSSQPTVPVCMKCPLRVMSGCNFALGESRQYT